MRRGFFEGVAGGDGTVFGSDLFGDCSGAGLNGGIGEQAGNELSGGFSLVVFAGEDLGDAEAADAAGVVGLVVAVGHDEHGAAGAQGLGGGADASLVDEDRGAGEELRIGRVTGDADGGGEFAFGEVAVVGADQENSTLAEELGGLGALLVEIAGVHDGGGAEGEDERGRT